MGSGGTWRARRPVSASLRSALFAAITTAASCGAVIAMHDSFTPLGGMVPMVMMQLGEVVFGGVGSGLYGMLVFAILAVFIAGLMMAACPSTWARRSRHYEMKMVAIVILVTPLLVLVGTAIAVLAVAGTAGMANPGHTASRKSWTGLQLRVNNNGSAFAGLSANTPFYNPMLGIAVWFGRFGVIVPVLAIAGSARRQEAPGRSPRHPAHAWPAFRRPPDRIRAAGRPAELRAGPGARTGRRAPHALANTK